MSRSPAPLSAPSKRGGEGGASRGRHKGGQGGGGLAPSVGRDAREGKAEGGGRARAQIIRTRVMPGGGASGGVGLA